MKLKLLTAAMLAMAIAPMQANALTKTATIAVSVTAVAQAASIQVAGPLSFGQVTVGGNNLTTATTSFDITVANGIPYTVGFGAGLYNAGFTFRMGSGNTNRTEYRLYPDSTKVRRYSAVSDGSASIANQTGTGVAKTYTLFSELLPITAPGSYSDTITITVAY